MSVVKIAGVVGLLIGLAGCATNALDVMGMEGAGQLRIDPPTGADQVYRVTVRNVVGIGFDGDQARDRLQLAAVALQAQCARLVLLDEQPIARGAYGTGRPIVDYVARLQCVKA